MQNETNEQTSNDPIPNVEPRATKQSSEADCATRAYFLRLAEGCDRQHWFTAEEELRELASGNTIHAS